MLYVEPHGGLPGPENVNLVWCKCCHCGGLYETGGVAAVVLCTYSSTLWNGHIRIHKLAMVCTLSPPLCVSCHCA
jgi:hypothetical protein